MTSRFSSFAAAVALGLAGCSGAATSGGPSLPASPALQRHGWISPDAVKQRLIYVSDNSANAILIYPQGKSNPAPIGEITDGIDGPLGTAVSKNGTLYVANSFGNDVTEYPPGATSPSVTLSDGLNYPISVAVDDRGTVAVGEFGQGEILEFEKGSTSPNVTITLLSDPEQLAFDQGRHLYAAWNVNLGSQLQGHVSICRRLRAICADQGIQIGESGGLALDLSGNLILGDQTHQSIGIYPPGSNTPSRTIATTGRDPYKFALNRSEKTLYVADITGGVVAIYNYATGAQTGTITNGLTSAWGVSLSPAAPYAP
ncbi:MAG TPA: hypothetical protein VJP76_02725 [Candidatus Tumulicola sp.]|nr:hypothetical protein [Candidatus Tumulicola sp.]